MFRKIFLKFHEILRNSKNFVLQNLHIAVLQQPFVGVEEEEGGVVGSGGGPGAYCLEHPPRESRLCLQL